MIPKFLTYTYTCTNIVLCVYPRANSLCVPNNYAGKPLEYDPDFRGPIRGKARYHDPNHVNNEIISIYCIDVQKIFLAFLSSWCSSV